MNGRQAVAACVLATLGTAVMTASKSSLLYLWTLKPTAPLDQWYATMLLVLVVPDVTSVLRTLWGSTLLVSGAMRHWPSASVMILSIVTAVLESAAMAYLTLEVAASLPPYAVLPLLHVLLMLQIMLSQCQPLRRRLQTVAVTPPKEDDSSSNGVGRGIVTCVLAALGLCLPALLAVLMAAWGLATPPRALAMLASLLALALAWCRPVRHRAFCVHRAHPSSSSSLRTRHNVILLLGVVRVGSVFAFTVLIAAVGAGGERVETAVSLLWRGLRQLPGTPALVWALVLHCLANMAAYLLTRLGAYFNATRSSMAVPTALSTALVSALFLFHCTHVLHVDIGLPACPVSRSRLAVLIVSVCVWILPLVTLRESYFQPSSLLFRPEMESFVSVNYNSVCLDQNLWLDYNPVSAMYGQCLHAGTRPSRVFLCTTMYREADYEMEQLLRSLSQVSRSAKVKEANVYLESHIFLDNGADDFTPKEFALQLIALIETCFSIVREDSVIHKTPYGVQIRYNLPGGMPLFLHLKDPSLVKAKKRWSQVMYMKYILDHRVKTTHDHSPCPSSGNTLNVNGSDSGLADDGSGEVLLQLRSVLSGFQDDSDVPTLHTPDRISFAEGRGTISEQSSYQGIDVNDEVSALSDGSRPKEHSPYPPWSHDINQSITLKTSNQSITLKPSNQSITLKPSNQSITLKTSNLSITLNTSNQSMTLKPSNIHGSPFISAVHVKHNPLYVSDDEEDRPSGWPPQMTSDMDGDFQGDDPGRLGSSSVRQSVTDLPIFSISGGLPISEIDCAATQIEVPKVPRADDDNTYILATDADMVFKDTAILDLVDVCNGDVGIGAACGRTHPMGKKVNPIVWYQIFEYAKDFWMIKSAQNVIGSVMCCPGCFSLYRARALQDVVHTYSQPTRRPGHVFTKDTGEDRWMCTLMMMRGWRLRYSSQAVNHTYCPDSLTEFIKQRRRWILSDFANSCLVFRHLLRLMRSNGCFSFVYALYVLQLFIIVVFSPGTTVVMLAVGVDLLMGAPYLLTMTALSLVFVLYVLACCVLSPGRQMCLTRLAIVVLGFSMATVVIATGVYVMIDLIEVLTQDGRSLIEHYVLLTLTGSVMFAALLHPRECYLLVYGVVYLFYFPAIYMLLPLYALCNIVDQSWGTRDDQKPKVPKLSCFPKLRRRKKKKGDKAPSPASCENQAEDLGPGSEQLQDLTSEEASFWRELAASLIGHDVNLGLTTSQLARGLRALRNKVVLAVLVCNLLWVALLSALYLWTLQVSGSRISAYGIVTSILYAFSFLIQILGMTIYHLRHGLHRLGKTLYGTELPHYGRYVHKQ